MVWHYWALFVAAGVTAIVLAQQLETRERHDRNPPENTDET